MAPIDTSVLTSSPAALDPQGEEALARANERASKIPIGQTLDIQLDINEAAFAVIGGISRIEEIRPELVATFGQDAADALDELVPAARCAAYGHAEWMATSTVALAEPAKTVIADRSRLYDVAFAICTRRKGFVMPRLNGGQAYVDIAGDVIALRMWFTANRAKLGAAANFTPEQLEAMTRNAESFLAQVKSQEKAEAPAKAKRSRTYTYFVRAYDEVRRMVSVVRWDEGDADVIAPSLFAGRSRKRSSAADETETPVVAAPVVAAPVTPPPVAPAAPVTPPTPIAPGLPGADPFIRNQ